LVLRINICGKNRHLRQARKRQAVKKPFLFFFKSRNTVLYFNKRLVKQTVFHTAINI